MRTSAPRPAAWAAHVLRRRSGWRPAPRRSLVDERRAASRHCGDHSAAVPARLGDRLLCVRGWQSAGAARCPSSRGALSSRRVGALAGGDQSRCARRLGHAHDGAEVSRDPARRSAISTRGRRRRRRRSPVGGIGERDDRALERTGLTASITFADATATAVSAPTARASSGSMSALSVDSAATIRCRSGICAVNASFTRCAPSSSRTRRSRLVRRRGNCADDACSVGS